MKIWRICSFFTNKNQYNIRGEERGTMESRAAKMTWDELNDKAESIGVAIIPAGSTERHGNHLPMETDTATAFEVACLVGDRTGAAVFPSLNYGIIEHPAFQGVFLSDNAYSSLVREVCLGVESLGFQKILFISGHGPNNSCIFKVLRELFKEESKGRLFCMAHCMTLVSQLMPDFVVGRHTGHSDFRETSIMLALDEKHVHLEKASGPERIAKPFAGQLQSVGVHVIGLDEGRINLCHNIRDLETDGGYGQVGGASREQGEKALSILADYLSRIVNELQKIRLPLE
jgi:creatinine amidohydrolase